MSRASWFFMSRCTRPIAVLCSLILVEPPATSATQSQELEVIVTRGDGATHLVNYYKHEQPAVEVRLAGRGVRGANVAFKLPESGPSGSFLVPIDSGGPKRVRSFVASTNRKGRVSLTNFEPNKEIGSYQIEVTVHHNGQTARAVLRQTNAWSETARKEMRAQNRAGWHALAAGGGVVLGIIILYLYLRSHPS